MASRDGLETRKLLAKGVVAQTHEDTAVGIKLRYIGTGTVTSVDTTATTVVLITTDGLTDTYTFGAGTSTMGLLVAAINADGIFEAKLQDTISSQATASAFNTATISASVDADGLVVYGLLMDTSGATTQAVCLSPMSSFNYVKGHRVVLQQIDYLVNNTVGIATLKVYTRTKNGTERLVFSTKNVDDTLTSLSWASGLGHITGGENEELVVFFDGTVVNASSNATKIAAIGMIE
jgi:hypothetical protein